MADLILMQVTYDALPWDDTDDGKFTHAAYLRLGREVILTAKFYAGSYGYDASEEAAEAVADKLRELLDRPSEGR